MQAFLFYFILLSFAPVVVATTWRLVGIGRVIQAHQHHSNLLVVTDLGVLARLSLVNGSVIWRSAPLPQGSFFASAAVVSSSAAGPVLAIESSNRRITAFSIENGTTLWQIPGCAVGYQQDRGVVVDSCDGKKLHLHAATGQAIVDPELDHSPSEQSRNAWIFDPLNVSGDKLTWSLFSGELRSLEDGRLVLSIEGTEVWSREDGLSHITDAALYTPQNSHSKESILVALSRMGVVYGLDAMDHGHLLWRMTVGRGSSLVTGHGELAVVVYSREAGTDVIALKTETGEVVLNRTLDGFVAEQAVVEHHCCPDSGQVCVRLLSELAEERLVTSSPDCTVLTADLGGGWLSFEIWGTEVNGLKDGKKTWHVDVPAGSIITAVEAGKRMHPSSSQVRPPAVRVTGDRRVLFKHIDPDMVLILAENTDESVIHAMVVDAKTGSLWDVVTHSKAAGPVSTVRGESWFVYSFWSTLMLEQEIHIIDMYEPESEVTRIHHALHGVANNAFGSQVMKTLKVSQRVGIDQCLAPTAQDSTDSQCAAENLQAQSDAPTTPVILRSSVLTSKRIVGLDITETALGLTEPSIAMILESGQVALVSKILLDARRPKDPDGFSPTEYLIPYRPILKLQSASRECQYFAVGNRVLGASRLAVAPVHKRESMCQIAVIGIDIMFSLVQPIGSFDALPEDFGYLSVIAMVLALACALFYTQRMKKKASLTRSW